MATAQNFLDAILAAPDDDAVRLVFSDWLEEHGDPDRAEFVRAQVELARGVSDADRREALRRREREMLVAHELEWLGPLAGVVRRAAFVRGFVERVTVRAGRLKDAAAHFSSAPVRHLILLDATDLSAADLPGLGGITTLDLREGCQLTAKGVKQFANAAHLGGVAHLHLRQVRLNASTIKALAGTPALSRLRTLDLYDAWTEHDLVGPILLSRHLAGLTALVLSGRDEEQDSIADFGGPDCLLRSLRRLHLSYCDLRDTEASALAASPHLAGLSSLDLTGNHFGRVGRRALQARFGERVRF